jgi:hypothetical protein
VLGRLKQVAEPLAHGFVTAHDDEPRLPGHLQGAEELRV